VCGCFMPISPGKKSERLSPALVQPDGRRAAILCVLRRRTRK
jgi:hypothetical protein